MVGFCDHIERVDKQIVTQLLGSKYEREAVRLNGGVIQLSTLRDLLK